MSEVISQYVSQNLKAHRKKQKLSIQELAEITKVSKTMIGEIERGNANPSISVLWKIAEGLKIPLTKLIEIKEPDITLKRDEDFVLINKKDGHIVKSIFPYSDNIEIFYLTLDSNSILENTGHSEGVKEYIYILEGKLTLILNNEKYILDRGDAIKFNGSIPHKLLNYEDSVLSIFNILEYT